MGREIKRVSVDFDWPMGRIWPGFMNSHCNSMEVLTAYENPTKSNVAANEKLVKGLKNVKD